MTRCSAVTIRGWRLLRCAERNTLPINLHVSSIAGHVSMLSTILLAEVLRTHSMEASVGFQSFADLKKTKMSSDSCQLAKNIVFYSTVGVQLQYFVASSHSTGI